MYIYNDYKGFKIWSRYYIQKFCPQIFYPLLLNYFYKKVFNQNIDLKNPKLFSEKLNYLKIFDATPQKTNLTDKITAKEYIQKNFPELKTARLYQKCNSFDEIDFSKCPESFLIKTNHATKTGRLIEDKSKIDYKTYKKYYEKVLNINYAFWGTLELQYKNIKPQIFIEEYLHNEDNSPFLEYEVYCFNGNPEFIECHNFNGKPIENFEFGVSFYYPDWKETDFALLWERGTKCFPNEQNKSKIIKYAKLLSKDFNFARIDFFEINDQLYFGEITFTPFTGDLKFVPEKYNTLFGEKLNITN